MDDRLAAWLAILGPGGTREMAERCQAALDSRDARIIDGLVHSALGPELAEENKIGSLDDLRIGGLQEVAAELGMSRQKLGHLRSGRRSPRFDVEPRWQLSTGPVWVMSDVRLWNNVIEANSNG